MTATTNLSYLIKLIADKQTRTRITIKKEREVEKKQSFYS